ncbi:MULTISPECIES: alpha/beta hydrolase [Actinomycetes]|uniref:alpha/beta hydrolase n=1 Tax=Actinomycetes TaxID=1760 RepID=UPI0004C2A91B|nr:MULTISPECIES: alpha/beta hydrolase [Actinomycetes]
MELKPFLSVPAGELIFRPLFALTLNSRWSPQTQRKLLEMSTLLLPRVPHSVIRSVTLGDRSAERVSVGATEHGRAVLYLHGGAYIVGSPATHRALTTTLARAAGAEVYALDYRLAPEHPMPAAVDDSVAAYLALLERGYSPESVAIAGDSAGGGLSVATARVLIDEHGVTPAALGLISPWVNPAGVSEDLGTDIVVNLEWSRQGAAAYLGDGDPTDPRYAPAVGPLEGLPPTLVQIGQRELLLEQVTEFVASLRAAGVDVTASDLGPLWHVAHTAAPLVTEAAAAVDDLGRFLGDRLRFSQTVFAEPAGSNAG